MIRFCAALVLCLLATSLWAQDPLNTYQYNRLNVLRGNGQVSKGPWFEWWYYKVVLPEISESFFFVYGVVNPWDEQKTLPGTRSYMGMGDFSHNTQVMENFPVQDFSAAYDQTYVTIKDNVATDKHFTGTMRDKNFQEYSWDISIDKQWAFNATGWATGKNITNIEWYPAQASALCSGVIRTAKKDYKFEHAPCYQDRNWGESFPDWWAWIVSNKFENNPDTTLAIGGGKPKVFGKFEPIESVAVGLHHKGKDYSWRPNDLDVLKISISFGKWEVVGVNKEYKIEVSGWAPKEKFMDLQFITPQGEVFHDYETLNGDISVKLYKRQLYYVGKWALVDNLITHWGGLEYGSAKMKSINSLFSEQGVLE